ncbi:MAG: TetR/AcrR family transcriptional regulator [Bacteroidetes bacterium]|nr:TetR/AcrR family transcriptional regulator [Bacteroidota bacterium]
MNFQISFKVNSNIYLKDPESSEVGKLIIKKAIDLIYELGFENFTFKKLAYEVKTTEATIYRYFENKHRLLLYILNWYWSYMEFLMVLNLQNIIDPKARIETILKILTNDLPDNGGTTEYNKYFLNQIVVSESSKVYLVKDVKEFNKNEVFKPYKDLCALIAEVISSYKPEYKYPKSLSSTIIETIHYQNFFSVYLPKLTDTDKNKDANYAHSFISDFVFKLLQ